MSSNLFVEVRCSCHLGKMLLMNKYPTNASVFKKPYEPPLLQTYGNLRSLTQGASMGSNETNQFCLGMNTSRTRPTC